MALVKIIKDGTETGGTAADKINAALSAIDAGKSALNGVTTRIDSLDKFKGTFHSLAELQAAHPTGNTGDYAYIDTGATDLEAYAWSQSNTAWESTGGSASGVSPADQAKLNHITISKDIDMDTIEGTVTKTVGAGKDFEQLHDALLWAETTLYINIIIHVDDGTYLLGKDTLIGDDSNAHYIFSNKRLKIMGGGEATCKIKLKTTPTSAQYILYAIYNS